MSPTPAAGSLFSRPLIPFTEMIYKFLAPVLSAQLITAPTGRPREIRNFAPEDPPRPAGREANTMGGGHSSSHFQTTIHGTSFGQTILSPTTIHLAVPIITILLWRFRRPIGSHIVHTFAKRYLHGKAGDRRDRPSRSKTGRPHVLRSAPCSAPTSSTPIPPPSSFGAPSRPLR